MEHKLNKLRVFLVTLNCIYDSDKEAKRKKIIHRDYLLREIGITVPVPEDQDTYFEGYQTIDIVVTGDQLLSMVLKRIDHKVNHEANVDIETGSMIARVGAILKKLDSYGKNLLPMAEYNSKVDVHMPGNALMSFNETMLLEDSCTDSLQDILNQGWRITCACPQPAQRRPDYILGRWNADLQTSGPSAARGPSHD